LSYILVKKNSLFPFSFGKADWLQQRLNFIKSINESNIQKTSKIYSDFLNIALIEN